MLKKSNLMHFEKVITQIKRRRNELQVTQEALADISGVGLRTLKAFESGRGNPTLKTLGQLADVLGLELCLQIKPTSTAE